MRTENQAWLGLDRLRQEKRKHLSKMSDRVSRNVLECKPSKFE